jgi:hypothetical protein
MMDDTNPFAPAAALPHTTSPEEPSGASPSPDPQGLSSEPATLSPALEKFKSCRWRATPDVGDFCTHRDVLPFAGKEGFVADSWCPDCAFYKLRRTPKKRERIDFSY